MTRYTEHGAWPKIRELFQTGVVHRFTLIPEDNADIGSRPVVRRHVPKTDPKYEWGEDTIQPITLYHANYPADLRAAMQDEEARIQAQFAEATSEPIEQTNREQIVLESFEAHEDLRELPDFLIEIQERRRQLLTIIRTETSERIASKCREHIRRMNHLWESMTNEQNDAHDEWHTKNIWHKCRIDRSHLVVESTEDPDQVLWIPNLS
jgi:DNA-binding Lrp family transcriptional regulator